MSNEKYLIFIPQQNKLYFLQISIVSFILILLKLSFKNPHNESGEFFFKLIQLKRSKLEK